MTNRLQKLREGLFETIPMICPERARIFTESMKKNEGQPIIKRRAQAFRDVLAGMSVFIRGGELLVGNQASSVCAAPVFPEYSTDWIVKEFNGEPYRFAERPCDQFTYTEEGKKQILEAIEYWKSKTLIKNVWSQLPENARKAWEINAIDDTCVRGLRAGKRNPGLRDGLESGAQRRDRPRPEKDRRTGSHRSRGDSAALVPRSGDHQQRRRDSLRRAVLKAPLGGRRDRKGPCEESGASRDGRKLRAGAGQPGEDFLAGDPGRLVHPPRPADRDERARHIPRSLRPIPQAVLREGHSVRHPHAGLCARAGRVVHHQDQRDQQAALLGRHRVLPRLPPGAEPGDRRTDSRRQGCV